MSARHSCPLCGRTSFYELDGLVYCSGGHQQAGGPLIADDDPEYGVSGKVRKRKEIKTKRVASKVYRGTAGFELYLQAWQYILWKQCYTLVHKFKFPCELWDVVRELWSLRLSRLAYRLEDNTTEAIPDETASLRGDTLPTKDHEDLPEQNPHGTTKSSHHNPRLTDTLAFIVIGALLLRYPISLAKIYRLVRREEICYIRAIRHVPVEIRSHLAGQYHGALDTTVIPDQEDLQVSVFENAAYFGMDFGMAVPALNWRLRLIEAVETLALPLEVFATARRLVDLLKLDFTYPSRSYSKRVALTLPEAQLAAIIVVATKLIFPFDADIVKRHPTTLTELAATTIDWVSWAESRHSQESETSPEAPIERGKEIEVTDVDVLQMDDAQLDTYMDWYQCTYVREDAGDGLKRQIIAMFPLKTIGDNDATTTNVHERGKNASRLDRLRQVQSTVNPCRVVSEGEAAQSASPTLRPGQQYPRFRSLDALSGPALQFHKEVAELTCLDVSALLRAVVSAENRLLLHQHEMKRTAMFADGASDK